MVPFILLLTWDWYSLPIATFFLILHQQKSNKNIDGHRKGNKKGRLKKGQKTHNLQEHKKGKK
jgi:hypothetical protein